MRDIQQASIPKKLELLSRLAGALKISGSETVAISASSHYIQVHLTPDGFLRLLNSRLRKKRQRLSEYSDRHCHFFSGPYQFTTIAGDFAEADRAVLSQFRSEK